MVTAVCTGGDPPPYSQSISWLDACQKTIAADGGLTLLKALGRKADLWVGDGDSLPGPLEDWAEWYSDAWRLDRMKDDSDTEAAVRAALDGGADEVWLLGGAGGRMDHWLSNLRLAAQQPRLTRWLTSHEQAWNIGPGAELAVDEGLVSVFPLGPGPWHIASQGFRWPLGGVDFQRWHSLSNEAGPGSRLTVGEGRFLVLRPLGGSP
jgi:thiamine pyrophosphokinase